MVPAYLPVAVVKRRPLIPAQGREQRTFSKLADQLGFTLRGLKRMAVRKLSSKPDAVYFEKFTCHQWLGTAEAQAELTPTVMECSYLALQ